MEIAPYFADVADGPDQATAYWLKTEDGLRIRMAAWPLATAKATVLIFPGRTEYIEKYGRAAADLQARGYACIAIDWRGHGLADRLIEDPRLGHVDKFLDYQLDIKPVLAAVDALSLPKPLYLMGHSMGGCIGLRAAMEGLDVKAAVYSAPMWGISLSPSVRPVAWIGSTIARKIGMGGNIAPGTEAVTYVVAEPFEGNSLTSDRDMFTYMRNQVTTHTDLAVGGPTLHWLNESLHEMRHLSGRPSPAMPTLTFLGTAEKIVDPSRIHQRMRHWGRLEVMVGAEHEIMMETPARRAQFFDQSAAHFEAHR